MSHPELRYPLVCFDLDGTLVDGTVYIWKTLHETFGTDGPARRQAHDDFFARRISYADWFHHDLVLLAAAGATEARIRAVLEGLTPMRGARETLGELRQRGHTIALISGSLDIVVEQLFDTSLFDHLLINRIRFAADGTIAGGTPTPYDLEAKAAGLRAVCGELGVDTTRAAFIGDNVNDVDIAAAAGLAIAFNCKSEELRQTADVEVAEKDLRRVLELIS